MSELEQVEATEEVEATEPQGEEQETDWKAEARKWEKYAKQNKEAAAELERIKQERMSESEKLQARAEKAERELAALSAERDRAQAAQEVSKASGVPAELLSFCADKERMEEFVQAYNAVSKTPAAPRRPQSRAVHEGETPVSNRDVFAEMMQSL